MGKEKSENKVNVFRFLWLYKNQFIGSLIVALNCGYIYVIQIENKKDELINTSIPGLTEDEKLVLITPEVQKLNVQCIIGFLLIVFLLWFLLFILFFKLRENSNPFYYWRHYYSKQNNDENPL